MRGLTILIACLVSAAALGVPGNVDNPELAWKNYLATGTGLEPRYRFPHATCFRAAAVTYQLPETLLLAVARGLRFLVQVHRESLCHHYYHRNRQEPVR